MSCLAGHDDLRYRSVASVMCVRVCVMSKQCCSVCGAGRSMDGCTYVCMYVGEEAHPGEASKRGWASPQAGRPSRQDEQACGGDYHKPPTGRETR
jgi:hypothetical protein